MPKIGAQLVSNAESSNTIASRALASASDRVKMAESKQSQIGYSSLLINCNGINQSLNSITPASQLKLLQVGCNGSAYLHKSELGG